MLLIEIGAVILSALGVWLTARRNTLCWPVGLMSVLVYGWIFWLVRLYSDLLLQCMYAILALYGWQRWSIQNSSKNLLPALDTKLGARRVRVTPIPRWTCLLGLLSGAAGGAALGALAAAFTDAALPWVDAALTSFSLVAEFWKIRRYIAHWRLWIAVDCVYVAMFTFKDLRLTAALYAGFMILAFMGLRHWRQADRC